MFGSALKSVFSIGLIVNLLSAGVLTVAISSANQAEAKSGYYHGRPYYQDRRGRFIDSKTGKILKGGLVGAGIGAGAGLITGRSVGRTTLTGAGVGAGVQATRHSQYMKRHPIVKTATYGALTGAGASTVLGDGRSLGKGAIIGGGLGAGLGILKDK